MTPTPTQPPACLAFDAVVNLVLDGERSTLALNDAHTRECLPCREIAAATRQLLEGLAASPDTTPPIGFADRVVPVVLAERKRDYDRRRTVQAIAFTLAASVFIAFFAANSWRTNAPTSNPVPPLPLAQASPPPSVSKSVADAGSAFVSLTKRAADESFLPAKSLFANLELVKSSPTQVPTPEPMKTSTSAVQPITNTAKRAFNLFLRDVGGLATIPSMKS